MNFRNLAAVEAALGVELPESYVSVLEDFGLPHVDGYHFYGMDELCWFTEHPMAETIPYDGKALVIGEDLGGNALVLLGFSVAGKPALSDEVYRIDHQVGEPEEVAMDLLELLQEAGAVLGPALAETIFEVAFQAATPPDALMSAIRDALTARGYTESEHADEEGQLLFVSVFGDGPTIAWLRDTTASSFWFGRRLAVLLGQPVTGWEVILRTALEETGEDEREYPVSARRVEIDATGLMRDVESGFSGTGANHGDPDDTAREVLWELIRNRDPGAPTTYAFVKPPPDPELSPRLQGILTAIAESSAVELTTIAGQQAVRIELADGTRQFSVVTDTELATLRRHAELA